VFAGCPPVAFGADRRAVRHLAAEMQGSYHADRATGAVGAGRDAGINRAFALAKRASRGGDAESGPILVGRRSLPR
jgi:hypothetical protein